MEKTFETVESAYKQEGFVKGDTIRSYKEDTGLMYPCIILGCETFESFRGKVLQGLVTQGSLISQEDTYTVYLEVAGQLVRAGIIPNTNLRVLVTDKAYDSFTKKAYLDEHTIITGDMLQALCPSVSYVR